MTLTHANFGDTVGRLTQMLVDHFGDWRPPRYFLHCNGGFNLDGLFDEPPQSIALQGLPNLPETPNADGETPQMLCGSCHGVPMLAQLGCWRMADGHGILPALLPVAVAKNAGAPNALFLDCALSLNPDLKTGRWGMLTDFINDFALSPLDGLHHLLERPFPNLAETLDQFQNSEIINALGELGETLLLCTFLGRPGFHLFTHAEIKVAQTQGADFIGHDLPLILIFAHALGMRVSSLVLAGAQQTTPDPYQRLARQDILETARFRSPQLIRALRHAIANLEDLPQDEKTADAKQPTAANSPAEQDADELIATSIRQAATRNSPLSIYLKRSSS